MNLIVKINDSLKFVRYLITSSLQQMGDFLELIDIKSSRWRIYIILKHFQSANANQRFILKIIRLYAIVSLKCSSEVFFFSLIPIFCWTFE